MEYQHSPRKVRTLLLPLINFLLVLVIAFCMIYIYIDFLFR